MSKRREVDDQAVTIARSPRDAAVAPTLPAEGSGARTIEPAPRADSNKTVDAGPAPLVDSEGGRYATRTVLGEGGMGEVRLCRDRRIGRDVAMKVVRPGVGSHSDLRARFEREARVQGQLEHPSIVPVYDLGIGEGGAAFFTMKRVRGQTLEDVLHAVRTGDPDAIAQHGTRRLLQAFTQVCQAIAFAHARGVLHRDLKPANVMLGDFGEVYVLDWGLAKLVDETEEPAPSRRIDPSLDETVEARVVSANTAVGTIMGTPGYMAPEQVRGELDRLDARTDVWALGVILFEILALEPLFDRHSPAEATLVATLAGVDARPSTRAPDRNVAPELEEIVVRATALDPEERHPSVRALLEEVERFLDGDRDLARRRELAEAHAERAREAAGRIEGEGGKAARAEAIREANRALALDPNNEAALATLLGLVLAVPNDLPPEAEAEWESAAAKNRRATERTGAWAYLSWFVVTPIFLHMGVRAWGPFLGACGAIVVAFVLAMLVGRGKIGEARGGFATFVVSIAAIGLTSLLFGPFVLVSGMAAANAVFMVMNVEKGPLRRWIVAASTLPILVPVALERLGVLSPSYLFHDGVIAILPRMASFPETATYLFLLVGNLTLVLAPSLLAARVHDSMRGAERRAFLHHWHLRQFLPDQARGVAKMPTAPDRSPLECAIDGHVREVASRVLR